MSNPLQQFPPIEQYASEQSSGEEYKPTPSIQVASREWNYKCIVNYLATQLCFFFAFSTHLLIPHINIASEFIVKLEIWDVIEKCTS